MRRLLLVWGAAFLLFFGSFAGVVTALNVMVYSASGFVGAYLDALAREDADSALAFSGVQQGLGPDPADDLLSDAALRGLDDIRLVSDSVEDDGSHLVLFEYTLEGQVHESEFHVERFGTRLGFFSAWRFVESPLSTVSLAVLHDTRFTVNGVDLDTGVAPSEASPYLVLTPGLYEFSHETALLYADPVSVAVTQPSGRVDAQLDVRPNGMFVSKVQQKVEQHLQDGCASQRVLQPTGCPFGEFVQNRVISEPVWTISAFPRVTLEPGEDPGTWRVPLTGARAHLTVEVQSLFDGTVSTLDTDVPFGVQYVVTVLPDADVVVTPAY